MLEPPCRLKILIQAASSGLVFALLSLGGVAPARADLPSTEAAAEARRSEAKLRFEEGVAAFSERRYADAVQAFLKADSLAPSAALSFNVARAFEHLEDPSSALRWYRDYRRRSPQAVNAAEVEARINELSGKLAERGVQQLTVLSTPVGAAVVIDNRAVGVTPLTLDLAPGAHQVHVRLAGYRDQQRAFVLDARTAQDLVIQLESLQPVAPAAAAQSPSGVARDSAAPLQRPFGVAPWIALGAGGAGLAAALSFELARRSAESEAQDAPQREYQVHYDAMRSRQTTARVLAAVGGALLVGGGVLLVLNEPKAPQVGASCSPSGCAAVAQGSF